MATEGPLYRDGAQCVAAANYWNPATTLYGTNGSGQFLVVRISAARTVALATVPTAVSYGVLQNTPDIGQAADVALAPSITKVVSGGANSGVVAAGVPLMVDATQPGCVCLWVAGAANYVIGYSIEAAAAANAVFTAVLTSPFKVVT
jgi:hypothetical protein